MTDAIRVAPVLVHHGVDWLTVTARGGKQALSLFESAQVLLREGVSLGNDKKPWSMSGFNGWKAGQTQCGTRGDEVIVRVSGDMAHDYWRFLYDDSDNCTRIDCQATYRLSCDVSPIITRHFSQAKRLQAERTRAPTVSLLSTNNGPSTVYLNRRISESFGRVYDKGAESGKEELARCIRYEVEYKGDEARRVSAYLHNHSSPDTAAAILAVEFMQRKGVRLGKALICSRPPLMSRKDTWP
jgi:predicted Fe-Mo cluster-binding NifX family protein